MFTKTPFSTPRFPGVALARTLPVLLAFSSALLLACAPRAARADAWALLIGIDQYEDTENIARLGGADNDATALAKALIDSGCVPAEHVRVLTSSGALKPIKRNILHELEGLRQRVQPGDTVYIAYSGHGVESDQVPYLLPWDADITTPALIRDSSIPEDKFREYLRNVPARALILVFDMCRVNADKNGKAGVTPDARLSSAQVRGLDFTGIVGAKASGGAPAPPTNHPQIVAEFFACSPNSRSYEWKTRERGYFSYYLEQGIRGEAGTAGSVSLDGLKRYLALAVPAAVRDNELGKEQTPTGDIIGPLDAGDFVLARSGVSAPVVVGAASANVVNTHASLDITVNAPNALITIDGDPLTSGTSYVANLLSEARRTVKVVVTAPGYDGKTVNIEMRRGVTEPLAINLVALGTPVKPRVLPTIFVAVRPVPAVKVLLTTLRGHTFWVVKACFSPDGRYILSGSMDRTAKLWDARTGQLVRTFSGHTDGLWATAFSADGKYVVTGSYDTNAKVWEATTGAVVLTLRGHTKPVFAASFSPDGKHIVTGSDDGTAKVWDAVTGAEILTLSGHTIGIISASYSPNGRFIVTGCGDGNAKVWDAVSGLQLRTLHGHTGQIWTASFSPDGTSIVTASLDGTAKIWDAATGQERRTLVGHTGRVRCAYFSFDGMYIVTGSDDKTAKIWNVATGAEVRTLSANAGTVADASFSPDGKYVVTANDDYTVRVWDAATGKTGPQ